LPIDEADAVLSLLGAEIGGLRAGDYAITNQKQYVTILGYTNVMRCPEKNNPEKTFWKTTRR
jgi:hypothetical protein